MDENGGKFDRRTVVKRGALAGGAVWAAPAVMRASSVAAASPVSAFECVPCRASPYPEGFGVINANGARDSSEGGYFLWIAYQGSLPEARIEVSGPDSGTVVFEGCAKPNDGFRDDEGTIVIKVQDGGTYTIRAATGSPRSVSLSPSIQALDRDDFGDATFCS